MHKRHIILSLTLLGVALLLAACGNGETPTPVTIIETVEVPVEVPVEPTQAPGFGVPYLDEWTASPHNAAGDEAFVHWDEDDPAAVPASCAKCHSTFGYLDFLGEDGSEFGSVDAESFDIGSTVTCLACHNDTTASMTTVVMPSGLEIEAVGREARCMQCHQGRHSTTSVNAALEEAGVGDDDVSEDVGFSNIHYYAAAATKYGTAAKGGYEYDGKTYDAFFAHVEGFEGCTGCHDPHTLEIKVETCTGCHAGVESAADFANVRMFGSLVDYDGDGDTSEGIAAEIEGLQVMLYQAIQAYATEATGAGVVYDSHAYPYFFTDTDGDGEPGEDEANFGNRFVTWTPRLAKAAYNYQVSKKDPGGYAHGGKYMIQLLYDSIEDLNTALSSPVDLSAANRIDDGHFAGSEEAFRHWDEDGEVSGSCSRCHSATGLPLYIAEGAEIAQPIANGFLCSTCHDDLSTWTRYEVTSVTFPSGASVDSGSANMNLCMNCHQGRNSGVGIAGRVASARPLDAEGEADTTRFAGLDELSNLGATSTNPHYFAAGATLFGSEVTGGFEYPGKEYVGRFEHVGSFSTCTDCHSAHGLDVKTDSCGTCHDGGEDVESIRISETDFDGDGDTTEGLYGEVATMKEALFAAIQAYAAAQELPNPVYEGHAYPYWFTDNNANGVADPDEANYGNQYRAWTPRMFRAVYNLNWAGKDPGSFAHNGTYILQLLYDSLQDLGGDVSGMTRP